MLVLGGAVVGEHVCDLASHPRRQCIVVHRTDDQTKSHFDRGQCGCVGIALRISTDRLVVLASLKVVAYLVDAIDGATDADQPIPGRRARGDTDALNSLGAAGCLLTVVHTVGYVESRVSQGRNVRLGRLQLIYRCSACGLCDLL
jgi:hypothetical protein